LPYALFFADEREGVVVVRKRKPTEFEKAMALRLKELRQARELTQEKLARLVDVGLDAIRKWERGDRTPGFDMAVRLADALNVSLDELAGRQWPGRKKRRMKDEG